MRLNSGDAVEYGKLIDFETPKEISHYITVSTLDTIHGNFWHQMTPHLQETNWIMLSEISSVALTIHSWKQQFALPQH